MTHVKVAETGTESAAIPGMLPALALRGCLVIRDGLGYEGATARRALNQDEATCWR